MPNIELAGDGQANQAVPDMKISVRQVFGIG